MAVDPNDPVARRKVQAQPSNPADSAVDTSVMPPWLQRIYDEVGGSNGYVLTPDDLQMLGYWSMMQQYQLGQGQTDLGMAQNDLGFAQVGLSEDQIKQAEQELGLSRAQLEEKWAEFNFQKEQAPLQHEVDMMNLQNQLTLGGYDVDKAKAYLQAQQYGAEAAGYGADASKYDWMAKTGQITPYVSPIDKAKMKGYGF